MGGERTERESERVSVGDGKGEYAKEPDELYARKWRKPDSIALRGC